MRAILRAHGVHRAALFPEPSGIVEEIRRRHSSMEDEQNLSIIAASYGSDDQAVDVTDILESKITGNELAIRADNTLAGDPCPGTPKELTVTFIFRGKRRRRICREGDELKIP